MALDRDNPCGHIEDGMEKITLSVDNFSRAVTSIETFFDGTRLSHASGFFWRHEDQPFLISNWHVFSGRSLMTGQPLDEEYGACPNAIKFRAHVVAANDGMTNYMTSELRIEVNGTVSWLQHPEHGQGIDVAAIAIGSKGDLKQAVMLNDLPSTDDMRITVGQDVFILGYPLPPDLTAFLPIWKRGTIASEPAFKIAGQPKFLIDSAVRPGMSGAPVIARSIGNYVREDSHMTFWGQEANRLVGVYSGRLGADVPDQVQLGVVWRTEVIDEVCSGQTRGEFRLMG